MNNKIRNITVTLTFVIFIAFFSLTAVLRYFDPAESSDAERRPLAQFPEDISWSGVVDKTVIDGFESYSVDQFPFREFFRSIKANFSLNILGLKENNGLAVEDGYIAKIEQDFSEEIVDKSLDKLTVWYEKFVKDNGGKHYLTLIPDKNYYLGRDYNYPSPDYDWLRDEVKERFPGMTYVDITDALGLEDYYRTDTHWSQDKILGVRDKLAAAMGISDKLSAEYKHNKLEGFKGVYYGQSALNPVPDDLVYLTSDILDGCTVFNYLTNETTPIYDLDLFSGKDGYDLFLSGTQPLLRIDNPAGEDGKTLVVFRDSYGSSLTPLLTEAYSTVYVVDIRYTNANTLTMYEKMGRVDFSGADVLFAYSSLILNSNSFQ